MTDGLIIAADAGRKLATRAQEIVFKVTGADADFASTFEVTVPPGFDVGAHFHTRTEELFYILAGNPDMFAFEPVRRTADDWRDWVSATGKRPVRAAPGTTVFVPRHCPHGFANRTDRPVRMLFQAAPPPDHERYFEELTKIFALAGTVDSGAVAELRTKYDVHQITPLRFGSSA
ncbi:MULTISPECIES: cupin domain-containing protein [unclassified Nocardia]|uniref:cupin domain-containing protein n=1 Tax=unclassified Nocardia TaxID=2637762 RepID=UPI001CE494A4|nr:MULTISPECIES: cupin domain-containing protein [unclassified Nocardia]